METPIAYQVITDRLVAMLEAGTVPWRKPRLPRPSHPRRRENPSETSHPI